MKVSELWEANYLPGSYCAFLYDEFVAGGLGKHFDSIQFWVDRFWEGKNTTIQISASGYVTDGNHRLVAAKIVGLKEIQTEVVCEGTYDVLE